MEPAPQPEGGNPAIYHFDEHTSPLTKDIDAESQRHRPPVTFAEARQHSAYYLLTELHDHGLSVSTSAETGPRQHLAELALSAAVVHWWSRWQPISMHRAFVAGAQLSEVAAASGQTEHEAYGRWLRWANAQSQLLAGHLPCLDPVEVQGITAWLADQLPAPG